MAKAISSGKQPAAAKAAQLPVDQRLTGVAVPVGALRGKGSLGVGEFADLAEFALLCKKMGLGLIQLLPVNDTGYESSPYGSLTAFALHPLYLRIEDLEEFKKAGADVKAKIAEAGQEFEKAVRFSHYQVLRAKIDILRDIYAAEKAGIAKKAAAGGSLAAWIEENPWVKEYAVFRRLKEANGEKSWKEWSEHQKVSAKDIEAFWNDAKLKEEHLFWAWIQEALDRQFSLAAKAITDAGLILEGDLPILMNEDSCDVWAHPEYFHLDLSAGAPPDMYSPEGQNWGFPTYDWQAQSKDDYAFWRKRLKVAEKYYQAYRIDHVLGFFRIWAASRHDLTSNSALGRFIPYVPVNNKDLAELGFDSGRIRWISRPHIPAREIWDVLNSNAIAHEADRIFSQVLDRLGSEDLWLFKDEIKGEKDIAALGLSPAAQNYLCSAWQNRMLLEYEGGQFFPVWYYRNSRAYQTLSAQEKQALETLLEKRRVDSERIWEDQGKRLLTVLTASSNMLPCAEDLGAVPDCVPRVLTQLRILGLRVVRWFRDWDKNGQPFIPFDEYPELSVCTPAVHDSSTIREWWDKEADQEHFSGFLGVPSLPRIYNPGAAKIILHKIAGSASRFRVFQIQDLLHLSPKWYAAESASERVNVPGTYNDFNWTYRLPASIEVIGADTDFVKAVEELSGIKAAVKKGKKQ